MKPFRRYSGNGSGGNTAVLIVAVLVIAIVSAAMGVDPKGLAVGTLVVLVGVYAINVFQTKRFGGSDFRI